MFVPLNISIGRFERQLTGRASARALCLPRSLHEKRYERSNLRRRNCKSQVIAVSREFDNHVTAIMAR